MRKINIMNKKVLWISVGSAVILGISGFFFWKHLKKKKKNKLLLEESQEIVEEEQEQQEETKEMAGEQKAPPHIKIQENVVYLSAKWCPACKENKETADELYAKYKDKVEFRVIDADEPIAASYGNQLGLKQIPVLAFINEGEVVETMVGIKTMSEYDAMFEKLFPSLKQPVSKKALIEKKVKKIPKKIEAKIEKKEVEVVEKVVEPMVDGNGDYLGVVEEVSEDDKEGKNDKE